MQIVQKQCIFLNIKIAVESNMYIKYNAEKT